MANLVKSCLGVISCIVRERWGKVAIAIDGNLLGVDPIHQEEARDLSSFLECIPVKAVDHSGHTLPLALVVETYLAARRWMFSNLVTSFLVYGFQRCNNIRSVDGLVKCRLAVVASERFL